MEINDDPLPDLSQDLTQEIIMRAKRINDLMKRSTEVWLEIAREVSDAKKCLDENCYDFFLKKASLTPAIANKMPRIAKTAPLYAEEAKKYVQRLEGWSTLYEVAKLKPAEIQSFFRALDDDPDLVPSRDTITRFRKTKSPKSNDVVAATILINPADLQRLSFDQFMDIKECLVDISRIIDRQPKCLSFNLKSTNLEKLEQFFMNTDSFIKPDDPEYCDDQLFVSMSTVNTDCGFKSTTL